MKKETIGIYIDSETAINFRQFVLKKYGRLGGNLSKEGVKAIIAWMKENKENEK
ncbi:MAG: hypothetical protein ACQXXG_09660 [Candidatus Bathyarchaeia archaeon]|jgi:hypothetical protein